MAEKIFVQVDGERVEATGETLEYVLSAQAEVTALLEAQEAERQAREDRKLSVIEKLGALGLTPDEVADVFGLEVQA